MKRVPTVMPSSRRTMRVLAIAQGLLIVVSLMMPITALGALTAAVPGPQAPNPVTAGGNATYTVSVTNSVDTSRGVSVTSISGLPAGASLLSSTCINLGSGATGSVTVVVATTGATLAGTYPIVMTASRRTPAGGTCTGGTSGTLTGNASFVVVAAPPVGTTTTITSDLPDPSVVNTAYTVNVSVTRASGATTITGTVTISDGTDSCTDPTPTGGAAATVTYSCALTSTTVGARTLTASFPANVSFDASSGTAAHTVSQANQTITFPALAGVRLDQAAPTTAATASSGLAVTYSTVSAACSVTSSGVITLLTVGNCTIAVDQAGNATYNAAPQKTRTFAIAKGMQTISFGALANKTLADPPVTIASTATSGLAVTFTSTTPAVCTVSGTTVTMLAVGTCSITASQAGDANWKAASPTVTQTFSIAAPPLIGTTTTITADLPDPSTVNTAYTVDVSVTRASGSTAITGTVTVSDGTDSCTDPTPTGGAAATVTYSCSLTSTTAGVKTLAASFPANATFSASSDTAAHTVKAAQTITFPTLTGVRFDEAAPTTAATASSGLAVSYSSASTACSVTSGGMITLLGLGTCTIDADQAGNATYAAAPEISRSFAIAKGDQTISFGALANKTMFDASFVISAAVTSGMTVAFASNSPVVCTVTGTTVTLLGAGTCSITASQAGNANWNAAAPTVTQTFTVVLASSTTVVTCPASVIYDGSAQTPCTVSVTGAGGLNLSPTPIYTLNTNVGTATASYTFAGDANHSGSSDSTTVDITSAATNTVVTFEPGPYTYTGSEFTATAVVTGGGGFSQVLAVVLSGDCTIVTVANGCTASATFSGDATYNASSDSQSITITQASQVIDFDFVADTTVSAGSFELVATSGSTLGVTFTSLTPAVCTVSGTTVTILAAGTCTIQADQAGNVNFAAAAPVTQSVEIAADGAAPSAPDTSVSDSIPTAPGASDSIPPVESISAPTAFTLAVVLMLMVLMPIRRRRAR